jgi:hypothetical protein
MYLRNNETRSRNHCCRGRAISITYSECVAVSLAIWYEERMRHLGVCIPWGSIIFFPLYLISRTVFGGK